MSRAVTRNVFEGLGVVLAALPLLVILGFYAYVVRARLAFGYWPIYSDPEAWSMGFTEHYSLLRPWFHVFPLVFTPFIVAIYDCSIWLTFRDFPKRAFGALAVAAIIVFTWRFLDPGGFIEWFLD